MKIVIVGAGVVGESIAKQLSQEGHSVSIIEKNPELARRLGEEMDVLTVVGNGTSPATMKTAGIETADMTIAVTESDEVNVIVCALAERFGVKKKIARIRNQEFITLDAPVFLSSLHVDMAINPEEEVVNYVDKLIETPGATDVADFAGGDILLRGFHVPPDAPIVGRRLMELRETASMESFLIVAIIRDGEIIIPRGHNQIQADDTIFVLISRATFPFFLPFVNRRAGEVRNIVIFGASLVGMNLAARLEKRVEKVTLLEPSRKLAHDAADRLSKTMILEGSGTDVELLKEAGTESADFFLAVSGDDNANILSALLANKMGAKREVVLVMEPDLVPMLGSIGVDTVVNPRLFTINAILRFVRRGRVRSVVKLKEYEAEFIEMDVMEGARIVGKPLSEVKFPEGCLVGAVVRGDSMVIPDGKTVINPGDKVILFTVSGRIRQLESLFTTRRLFS